jgi:hypothetical protein
MIDEDKVIEVVDGIIDLNRKIRKIFNSYELTERQTKCVRELMTTIGDAQVLALALSTSLSQPQEESKPL